MGDKTYRIQFKGQEASSQLVVASTLEVHGDQLAFLNSGGKLAAVFPMKSVKSWSVINDGRRGARLQGE